MAPPDDSGAAQTVQQMLDEVIKEIADYDALKLPQLKGELDAFAKKKQGLVDDYAKQYPTLLANWKALNTRIADLVSTLKCKFPDWRSTLKDCACPEYDALKKKADDLDKRRDCGGGANEKARDKAKAELDAAKAELDALSGNAKGVADAMKAITDTLDQIDNKVLKTPQKAQALQLLWLDALPKHVALAPAGLPDDCLNYAKGDEPSAICDAIEKAAPHAPPWLIDPGDPAKPPTPYDTALDAAWLDYRAKRKASAEADAAYAKDPDDLAASTAAYDASVKARDGKIRDCLGKKVAKEPDCDAAPAAASAAAAAPAPGNPAAAEPAVPAQPDDDQH